jgi:acetate kinase
MQADSASGNTPQDEVGQVILSINGGSSSVKFAVYRMAQSREERLLSGAAEGIGTEQGRFWVQRAQAGPAINRQQSFPGHASALQTVFGALLEQRLPHLDGAGHRIVHGGPRFFDPQVIGAGFTAKLRELVHFAPLHLPIQIELIEAVALQHPELPQVACFDTAFHRNLPEVARRFPLPRALWNQGVMRYGFHGLSYEYVVSALGAELGKRAIIAHLGNGASMVALKDGEPMDTSMGLTPTGGFMMGTRSGDLDPGVLLHLLRQGRSPEHLAAMLDHESGLLGVSGFSSDMKTLLEKRTVDSQAAQAVQMFCYHIRKFIGSYAAVLNGLDTLVFTGGIGERAAAVRAEICFGLDYMGVELEQGRNAANAGTISSASSRCVVRVVQTDEDRMIARHTARLVQTKKALSGKFSGKG